MSDINPATVEREIVRLSALLEDRTHELGKLSEAAAESEYAYKREAAVQIVALTGEKLTADQRSAKVLLATDELLRQRLLDEAIRDSCQESCRSIRAQLSALQTLSANVRAQA